MRGAWPVFIFTWTPEPTLSPLRWGPSVLSFKWQRRSRRSYVDVVAVDLSKFVLQLARPIAVLKIDVEGGKNARSSIVVNTGAIEYVNRICRTAGPAHPGACSDYNLLRERLR